RHGLVVADLHAVRRPEEEVVAQPQAVRATRFRLAGQRQDIRPGGPAVLHGLGQHESNFHGAQSTSPGRTVPGTVRALLQRVSRAPVAVDGETIGRIGRGWLVLLGVGRGDTEEVAAALAEKVVLLRCFEDEEGKTNRSAADVGAEFLVISQFTLY